MSRHNLRVPELGNRRRHLMDTVLMLFVLTTTWCISRSDDAQDFQQHIPAEIVWAALEKDVDLPCDITPPTPQDGVKLVLWFKDSTGIPLYSLDSRNGRPLKLATHSALAGDLGKRLFFAASESSNDGRLQIRSVSKSDNGVYRCRVDFFNSPTRNFRVNLTLVEPPDEPKIFDAQGNELSNVAGPFREGNELFLSCQVNGGRPTPKVWWYRDGKEISVASHSTMAAENGGAHQAIVNQLLIGSVTRDLYGAKFQCQAQGSTLIPSVRKEISVQIHLKPLRVTITTPNELLRAGQPVAVRCETWGSSPPAKITWLLDGEPIRAAENAATIETDKSNMTSSTLTLFVSAENDGAELSCRSTNPWFSGGALEDKRIISVAYPPTVSVHLATEETIRTVTRAEGQNVTLKCRADSRPPVTSYAWIKNGMRMSDEETEILHLTGLERESGGLYACTARNTEGETQSTSLTLRVQFAPRCKPGTEQSSIGAINMHSIQVQCEVEADPSESVRFSWTYNSTRNVSPVLNSRITSNGLSSAMTYMPQSDVELVTLACWANNAVGRQMYPCLVHIIPAKVPNPPRFCELHNETVIEVVCTPGNDGGLTQEFLLQVIEYNRHTEYSLTHAALNTDNEIVHSNEMSTTIAPIQEIQEATPHFRIQRLESGREYQFIIYSINGRGRSYPPVIIDNVRVNYPLPPYDETVLSENPTPAETLNLSEKEHITMAFLAAAIAASSVIVLSIIVAGVFIACRRRTPASPVQIDQAAEKMRPSQSEGPSMYSEDDDLDEDMTRSTELRPMRSSMKRPSPSHTLSEAYVQYSQPSLNDPDLILPRDSRSTFLLLDSVHGDKMIIAESAVAFQWQ